MDDLNTILGIVVAIPVLTLFTVYWLNARLASAHVETHLRAKPQHEEHYESNHSTSAERVRMSA